MSDHLAHQLVEHGLDFAQEDQLTVLVDGSGEGTHLASSLKDLQKLGVDNVLLADSGTADPVTRLTVQLGDGFMAAYATNGVLPKFGDTNLDGVIDEYENAALDVTLNIQSWSDIVLTPDLAAALSEAGIDHIDPPVSLDNLITQPNEWIGLNQVNVLHNAGLDYVQNIFGSFNHSTPSSLDSALTLELEALVGLGKLSPEGAVHTLDALNSVDLLGSFTSPDKFGDLISALTNSGVADFVIDGGSVEISDPLAAALVDAGMLQALPQANLVIDASNSGDHLFTSLKAMADLGIDAVTVGADKFYVDLGLPVDDVDAIADIKKILAALDPANSAKPIFDQGHGALVIDNNTAMNIHNAGGLDAGMIEALQKIGITEIDVLADSQASGQGDIIKPAGDTPVAQTPIAPIEVKVIGMAEDPGLHDHLQPHAPAK